MAAADDMNFRTRKLRRFLTDMHNRGFKVYLIITDPRFAIPDPQNPIPYQLDIGYKNYINPPFPAETNFLGFIPFQKGGVFASERFDGLMLDIEPHQLGTGAYTDVQYSFFKKNAPEGTLDPQGFPVIWETYKNLLSYTENEIVLYNALIDPDIDYSDSIAGFYADITYDPDNGTPGDEENLAKEILDRLDFYTILAYRDTADPNGIFPGIKDLVNLYRNVDPSDTVPYVITVETTTDLLDNDAIEDIITFYEEGNTVLETELANVFATFSSDPLFSGLSIHSYADNASPYRGYQHLAPDNDTHAPIVTITSPNGSPIDGINFTGDIQITWDSYVPRNTDYTVELFYAMANSMDINDDSTWTFITQISNTAPTSVPPIASGSYLWTASQTSSISTLSENRAFIIARISYDTAPALATADTTDYGVAINEEADVPTDSFGNTQTALFPGFALGLQMIPDNDSSGVIHAVYYVSFGNSADFGIYYTRSTNWGATWSSPIRISNRPAAFPRKPSFHKNGQYLAVAWVENENESTPEPVDQRIHVRLHNANGIGDASSWQAIENLTERLNPLPFPPPFFNAFYPTLDYPDVYVDDAGDVHVTWHAIYSQSTFLEQPYVNYIHYIRYNRATSSWIGFNDSGYQRAERVKDVLASDGLAMKTPSVIKTSHGTHVVWGEYYDSISTQAETIVPLLTVENFNNQTGSVLNSTLSTYNYVVFGSEYNESIGNTIVANSSNPSDPYYRYLRIPYSSPTDGGSPIIGGTGPFASFGLGQDTAFSPVLNLSTYNGAFIEFDMKTNLPAGFADVLSVEIVAQALFLDNTPAPEGQTGFRLGFAKMLDLPGTSWTHYVVDINDLTTFSEDQSVTSKKPNLANITKIRILILQTDADLTGTGQIDIDNLTVTVNQSGATEIENVMRMAMKTKSGSSWPTEDTIIRQREYPIPQLLDLPPDGAEFAHKPVFFPKLATAENDLYLIWQETNVGAANSNSFNLEAFSDVLFNKSYDGGTTWEFDCDAPQQLTAIADTNDTGFNPDISAFKRDNDGKVILQVVYSDNFQEEIFETEPILVGDLIYRESDNSSGMLTEGNSWSSPAYFALQNNPANSTDEGIRQPYTNVSSTRAQRTFSPPYIYTSNTGISITNWLDRLGAKRFKLRGDNNTEVPLLLAPPPPFADIIVDSDNVFQGFRITWSPPEKTPETNFTPNEYILERIEVASNGSESSTIIPAIFSLSYDDDSITFSDNVYYRYRLKYLVGTSGSQSINSNTLKKGTQLLIDDFESYGSGIETHFTGNNYTIDEFDNAPSNTSLIQSFITDGTRATQLVYDAGELPSDANDVAFLNIIFPALFDVTNYGSIDMRVKVVSAASPRNLEVRLLEDERQETEQYRIGNVAQLDNSGDFTTYHFFLDQISRQGGETADGLDKNKIQTLQIRFESTPDAQVVIDDIVLSNDPVLDLSTNALEGGVVSGTGAPNKGVVISEYDNTAESFMPVTVRFGNGKDPWYLRIYTDPENDSYGNTVRSAGLVRRVGDRLYPEDTIPIKIWISNFGPARFFESFDDNGDGAFDRTEITYYTSGVPPVGNEYFWKGFDFDGDGKTFSTITENSGIPIVEGFGQGEYPFDIDGDGFRQGDNFFDKDEDGVPDSLDNDSEADNKKLSENPSWLFVPLRLNVSFDELTNEDKKAVEKGLIMIPSDDPELILTWRILASTFIGHGNHEIDMYFSVALNTEALNPLDLTKGELPNNYGTYKATVYIDLAYN